MNQRIGYARVSTEDQHLGLQRDALQRAGCGVIYEEAASGKANEQIMEGWNMGIVRSMRLHLPPVPLQTAFAEQAQRLEATAHALDTAAAKAEAMAAALSAEVFGDSLNRGNGNG